MYSSDKYGKLKKQIDRYFLPLEVNSQFVLEALKLQDKKNCSPNKIKQQTLAKINEEACKFQLLRITGRQLNSNFVPINLNVPRPRVLTNAKKNTPQKQYPIHQIRQILNEPLDRIANILNKDPELFFISEQLEQISRINRLSYSQVDLKPLHNLQKSKNIDQSIALDQSQKQKLEKIIIKDPIFYKKMLYAYYQQKKQKEQMTQRISPSKKYSVADGIMARKPTGTFNKFKQSVFQKNLSPNELKKHYLFVKYRQFLLSVALSNKIIIYPQNYAQYKAFICKGNNGILVKSILKTRPWWCLRSQSDIDNCTLIWTQWKKTKLIKQLPVREDNMQSHRNTFYTISTKSSTKNRSQTKQSQEQSDENSTAYSIKHREIRDQKKKILEVKKKYLQMLFGNKNSCLLEKYLQQDEYSMFTFTRKINEKIFEDISKKYITQSIHNYRPETFSQKREISSASLKNRDYKIKIINHLPGCLQLHSKKLLFINLKKYCEAGGKNVFDFVPETFVISKSNQQDQTFQQFIKNWQYNLKENTENKFKNIWICKPGQNSNRGHGITVANSIQQIRSLIRNKNVNSSRTLLIQRYIQNPFLYNKRKFDIRCYMLFTSVNGYLKSYWFNQGYIRTASKQFTLKNLDNKYIHLTNDAIQKKGEEYGKFESCNKISFNQFEKYLTNIGEDHKKFTNSYSQMKQISTMLVKSCAHKLNSHNKQYCFEVFGLDFMIDTQFKPYLIQANSNPCLQVDGSVLSKIIPVLIQNVIKIAIDPIFPPPYGEIPKNSRYTPANSFETNKFELIYDSLSDCDYRMKIEDLDSGISEQEQEDQQFQNNDQQ